MKRSLFVVYYKLGKSKSRIYYEANGVKELVEYIYRNNYIEMGYVLIIKRLKRIYRKTDIIYSV